MGGAWIHKYRTTWAFHKTHAMPVCALPAFPQLVSRSKDREIWRKQQWKCGKKVHLPLRSLRPHWPSTWGLQLFCLGPSFFWNELTTTLRQHSPCHVEAWYLWFGDWAKLLELFEGQQLSIIQHRKCCPTDWFLLPARDLTNFDVFSGKGAISAAFRQNLILILIQLPLNLEV